MKPSEIEEESTVPDLEELPYETMCAAIRCHLDMLESSSHIKHDAFDEVKVVPTFTKKEQSRIKSSLMLWFNMIELEVMK